MPLVHLVYFPNFCITIVSNFLWVLQPSQEILETMLNANNCFDSGKIAYTLFPWVSTQALI